jgi:hypothetical protein
MSDDQIALLGIFGGLVFVILLFVLLSLYMKRRAQRRWLEKEERRKQHLIDKEERRKQRLLNPPPPFPWDALGGLFKAAVGAAAAAHTARHETFEEYLATTRTPSQLRIEIKRIAREIARRDELGHNKARIIGATQGHDLVLFTNEQLHHAHDTFEEHLTLPAAPPKNPIEEELGARIRASVDVERVCDEFVKKYPDQKDFINRERRKAVDAIREGGR